VTLWFRSLDARIAAHRISPYATCPKDTITVAETPAMVIAILNRSEDRRLAGRALELSVVCVIGWTGAE
jgi:hypothetical protein